MRTYLIILLLALTTTMGWTQKQEEKLQERYNVNEDVAINVQSQYADIVFENWNKDEVEVTAVIEGDDLSDAEIKRLKDSWNIRVQGNSNAITIRSTGGSSPVAMTIPAMPEMEGLIANSLQMVQPMMENLIGPMLEGMTNTPLPQEFYKGMKGIQFDYEAYKRDGEKYLEEFEKSVEKSYGPKFEKAMEEWGEKMSGAQFLNIGSGKQVLGMPAFPFGSGNIVFNAKEYKKDKKAYVDKLNKKHNTNVTVKEMDKWLEKLDDWEANFESSMEAWGENLGKKMEAWGETHGAELEKKMEAWSENFGAQMEAWGEKMAKMAEETNGSFQKKETRSPNGNVNLSYSYSGNAAPATAKNPVKRKIIIKMPKKARLDLDVRHGKIKIADAKDARITLSHGGLTAANVDGDKTYFTVSYSPVDIDTWNYGTLKTSYAKQCVIGTAKSIRVDSRASNVTINEIEEEAYISGSFGKLTLPKLGKNFSSLNISLENSDLILELPETAYHFSFTGSRNSLILPDKLQTKTMDGYDSKMVNGFYKSRNTDSNISINAKFSDVVLQ
ncbi:MAG: hypothetical protein WBG71_12500 [Leeuwenhoekiella sp.]